MDFTNRNGQTRATATESQQNSGSVTPTRGSEPKQHRRRFDNSLWFKLASVVLLFSGTILIVAVLLFINLGSPSHENKYINKNEYQAVFINVTGTTGGAVYIGHVTDLSDEFVRLTNVFYIQKPDNSQNANLVKLGCELHGPEDEMVVNRDQVFFWENLKSSGQVTQKIAEWYKDNPNGQKCTNTNNSTQQSGGSSTNTNASSSNSSTNTGTNANSSSNSSSSTNKSTTNGTTKQ